MYLGRSGLNILRFFKLFSSNPVDINRCLTFIKHVLGLAVFYDFDCVLQSFPT